VAFAFEHQLGDDLNCFVIVDDQDACHLPVSRMPSRQGAA
jgi:hypothetical protein